jgi:hypothetical protein
MCVLQNYVVHNRCPVMVMLVVQDILEVDTI